MVANFIWTTDTLRPSLATLPLRLERGIVGLTEKYGEVIKNEAQLNAPWTDRTSNARGGLRTVVTHSPTEHRITLMHRVPYGIFLELCNDGKYRIIMPTLDKQGRKLMKACGTLVKRMGSTI